MKKYQSKIHTVDSLTKKVEQLRATQKRITFTNGCFDLLHRGHVDYLQQARLLSDFLVVGINSDLSVQRLKGKHRPIQDEYSRLSILASLESIDAVILFDQDTPLSLIQLVKPDFLVKGGDWNISKIAGAEFVLSNGGIVKNIPFLEGYSTSLIESKIKNSI